MCLWIFSTRGLALLLFLSLLHCKCTYLQIVSISIPEKPNALSPWMEMTLFPGAWSLHQIPAATANPNPTPIVPKLPASNLSGSDIIIMAIKAEHQWIQNIENEQVLYFTDFKWIKSKQSFVIFRKSLLASGLFYMHLSW